VVDDVGHQLTDAELYFDACFAEVIADLAA
jgi:hypothetical protein